MNEIYRTNKIKACCENLRSDLVYRCNDHVPEAIYYELPDRLRSQVDIDTTRPPAPVSRRKREAHWGEEF